MTKTLIDVDDALLAEVSAVLGTTTKKQTVNLALARVLQQVRRDEAMDRFLAPDHLPDLGDPGVRDAAWNGHA
jgi:Arc/MetJ family transcription regulator